MNDFQEIQRKREELDGFLRDLKQRKKITEKEELDQLFQTMMGSLEVLLVAYGKITASNLSSYKEEIVSLNKTHDLFFSEAALHNPKQALKAYYDYSVEKYEDKNRNLSLYFSMACLGLVAGMALIAVGLTFPITTAVTAAVLFTVGSLVMAASAALGLYHLIRNIDNHILPEKMKNLSKVGLRFFGEEPVEPPAFTGVEHLHMFHRI